MSPVVPAPRGRDRSDGSSGVSGRWLAALAALIVSIGHADHVANTPCRAVRPGLTRVVRIGAKEDVDQVADPVGRSKPVLALPPWVPRAVGVGAAATIDAGRVVEAEGAGGDASRHRCTGGRLRRAVGVDAALVIAASVSRGQGAPTEILLHVDERQAPRIRFVGLRAVRIVAAASDAVRETRR